MTLIYSLIILSAVSLSASAGDPGKIFEEFKNVENAEYVKVPRFLMWLARATGGINDVPMAGKVSGVKVLEISGIKAADRARFDRRLASETSGLEELINVKDDGSKVRIFSHADGKTFKNLYILATDSADCSFIEISGKFTADDLKKICDDK